MNMLCLRTIWILAPCWLYPTQPDRVCSKSVPQMYCHIGLVT